MYTLRIDVEPVALGRPRFGSGGQVYVGVRDRIVRDEMVRRMREAAEGQGGLPLDAPFVCDAWAFVRPPRRILARRRKDGVLNPRDPAAWPLRGDVDNLLKTLLDAGTGVLWTDDRLCVEARIGRIWSPDPAGLPWWLVRLRTLDERWRHDDDLAEIAAALGRRDGEEVPR